MNRGYLFADRVDAGRKLAERLRRLDLGDAVVEGLPRGGVPVAAEVAAALRLPLDIVVVRKLGVPYQPEVAMGAIGEGGVTVLDEETLRLARVGSDDVEAVTRREQAELDRRVTAYRNGRPPVPVAGRTVIVVDDGIATGATARAACQVLRHRGARRVILAVPVAPAGAAGQIDAADEVVALETPTWMHAVGQAYRDFSPVPDEEVVRRLRQGDGGRAAGRSDRVEVDVGTARLPGDLVVPPGATAVVVFAHGSGSSRHSPRNRLVAESLHRAGLGTLLFDLLTPDEELDRRAVFDVPLLADRLTRATSWLRTEVPARMPVGWFGASTGAGAALWAAAEPGADVGAVVSRGGRPDLAASRLSSVRAPTLLVVGGDDELVLDLNRRAAAQLRCVHELQVVTGATHLFEEPGALDVVASLAASWFVRHLGE